MQFFVLWNGKIIPGLCFQIGLTGNAGQSGKDRYEIYFPDILFLRVIVKTSCFNQYSACSGSLKVISECPGLIVIFKASYL